jgi:ATP-dependent RNA helicase DDX23/PRP28
MAGRTEPLSIESLLQKQKAEKEAASKVCVVSLVVLGYADGVVFQPKFLSKEERAKLAIAKRAEEIKAEKQKEEHSRKDREALEREAEDIRRRDREQGYGSGGRQNGGPGPNDRCTPHISH